MIRLELYITFLIVYYMPAASIAFIYRVVTCACFRYRDLLLATAAATFLCEIKHHRLSRISQPTVRTDVDTRQA